MNLFATFSATLACHIAKSIQMFFCIQDHSLQKLVMSNSAQSQSESYGLSIVPKVSSFTHENHPHSELSLEGISSNY